MPPTFYHAAPRRFRVGQLLHGENPKKNFEESLSYVYLNVEPLLHLTIAPSVLESKKTWFLYEVLPLEDVVYSGEWEELLCRRVEVVRCLGNAKEIHLKKQRSSKEVYSRCTLKNMARWAGKIKGVRIPLHGPNRQLPIVNPTPTGTFVQDLDGDWVRVVPGNAVSRRKQRRVAGKQKHVRQHLPLENE